MYKDIALSVVQCCGSMVEVVMIEGERIAFFNVSRGM
jgi:hypothetical protein